MELGDELRDCVQTGMALAKTDYGRSDLRDQPITTTLPINNSR